MAYKVASDETLEKIAAFLETIAAKAEYDMVTSEGTDGATATLTASQIQRLVEAGYAEDIFEIGDQLTVDYTYNGTIYEAPLDIVAFYDVELEDGETVPGLWLQWHYATIESLMFDSYEAFYVAEGGLEAGTYNITMGTTYGSYVTSGTTYQFTLTEDVPEGGFLAGFQRCYDYDPTTLSVISYDSDLAKIETVSISEGSDGTSLGTAYGNSSAASSGLNHLHRFAYGYGRWAQSAYRQWLNSDADAGEWWAAQNDYDLPPSQLSSYAGFLQGFDDDFLSALKKIKVTTALNTVEGLSDTSEDTIDTFFLPSLEQLYITPQLSGVEGDYWPYWKAVLGLESAEATGSTNTDRITYAVNSHTSAQTVRLRSAYRGYASYVWSVYSSGYVYNGHACTACRCAPACVIA